MKKFIGTIALIISFVLLANTKVAANNVEFTANNKTLLSKQELLKIVEEKQFFNLQIDLKPIVISVLSSAPALALSKTDTVAPTVLAAPINADD